MRIRMMFLPVLAVMAVSCAMAAASASAAEWYAGGSPLKEASPIVTKTGTVKFYVAATASINCNITLVGAKLSPKASGSIESIKFGSCVVESPSECTLVGKEINTKPLTIEAALGKSSPEDTLLLKPTSGTTFTEFKLEGGACSGLGKLKVTGTLQLVLPKGREELASQELLIHETDGELKISGGGSVEANGSGTLGLTSGKTFSFH